MKERKQGTMGMLTIVMLLQLAAASVQAASPTIQTGLSLPCKSQSDPKYSSGMLVDCSGQNLTDLPSSLPSQTTTLLFAHNNLSSLYDNVFNHVPDLRELDLSINSISVLEPQAFAGLGKLVQLSLRGNNLALSPQTYSDDVFTPLQSLQFLDISCNSYSGIHPFNCKQYAPPDDTLSVHERDDLYTEYYQSESMFDQDVLHFQPLNFVGNNDNRPMSTLPKLQSSPETVPAMSAGNVPRAGALSDGSYPDVALSRLTRLSSLSMDGLPNTTWGPGFRKLTNLTHVDLNGKTGHCDLQTLNSSTLATLESVTYLNISDCNVTEVTDGAFASVPTLQELDLSYNQDLGFTLLGNATKGLASTRLEYLTVDAVVQSRTLGTTLTEDVLTNLKNLQHLKYLSARFNRIEGVAEGVLCSSMPPNLQYLLVDGNLLELASYVNDLHCLRNLTYLQMNGLSGYFTPPLRPPDSGDSSVQRCKPGAGTTPHREVVSAIYDDDVDVAAEAVPAQCVGKQFSVPPQLTMFMANNFGLSYKLSKVRINAINVLTKIDMSQNYLPVWHGPLCGFHSVKELHLSQTQTVDVNQYFFPSFPALEVLNVSRNFLREAFISDYDGRMLRGLNKLRVLDMSANDLGHLQNGTVRPLVGLEELYLTVNGMATFNLSLDHMPKIRHLDLSQNQLHTLPKYVRDHLDQVALTYNVTINMTFNPIACICSNIEFLTWIRESPVYFGRSDNYYCLNGDGSETLMEDLMVTIANLERTCGSYVGLLIGATACCVLLFGLLLGALAYRYRWKLRYMYYASRLALQRRNQQQRQQDFDYDAFVSFASEDDDFVMGELRQQLEVNLGLELCIHTRDFIPGQYITSNIVDCIQRSRRTLVVLTGDLLASDWCKYEMQMALMEAAHTGRDVLIFLLYEHVPAHQLSREMLANLQATSYIEFPHEEADKDPFWSRLAMALRA